MRPDDAKLRQAIKVLNLELGFVEGYELAKALVEGAPEAVAWAKDFLVAYAGNYSDIINQDDAA